MDNKIEKLIKTYNKKFDINTQRAELLSRNKHFIKELNEHFDRSGLKGFMPYKGHFQKGREEQKARMTKINKSKVEDTASKLVWPKSWQKGHKLKEHLEMHMRLWAFICKRWNIMPEWDGDLKSLSRYMEPPMGFYLLEGNEAVRPALLMSLNEWTTLSDIKSAWGQVEEYQDQLWKKQEKRTNFARDLFWYDLLKKQGLKIREIAELWEERYPEEIDLLVLRRIKKRIAKEDLRGKVLDEKDLLKETKSGFLAEKYKQDFEIEREDYVSSGEEGKKITPPFIDAIKKAIKRMEQQINASSQKATPRLDQILSTGNQIVRQ
jgi:hypothetical protein